MSYEPGLYALPTVTFMGGSQQHLEFLVYYKNQDNPFDLKSTDATDETTKAWFSFTSFADRDEANPVWRYVDAGSGAEEVGSYDVGGGDNFIRSMRIEKGDVDADGDEIWNKLCTELLPLDTVNLSGKFIYQITIRRPVKDKKGKAEKDVKGSKLYTYESPGRGVLFIKNNFQQAYIT